MDKVHTITRRGALIVALVTTATIAVPASAAVSASPSILKPLAQWQAAGAACDVAATEEAQRQSYEVYAELQSGIVEMTPTTAREAAMPFVVETNYGDTPPTIIGSTNWR